jgi:transcriptional regulator with XRE-family HTH domain
MATDTNVSSWHPLDNPECTNCKGLSRPVRPTRKPSHTPEIVPLQLNSILADRKHLRTLVEGSRLPQGDFARLIGVTQSTLWRWLTGGTIPQSKRDYLNRIQTIRRYGADVVVVYRVYVPGPRWDAELTRRDDPLVREARRVQHIMDAQSRPLFRKTTLPQTFA